MSELNKKTTFVIDDGTRCYTFTNKFGDVIGEMHFRGGDISIIDRYNSLLSDFDKIIAPLSQISTMKDDGTAVTDEDWGIIKDVEKELINRLNAIFDSHDCENLFKNRNAFSTINGEFYVEKIIQALGNVVAQEMNEEKEKTKKRLDKYTKGLEK